MESLNPNSGKKKMRILSFFFHPDPSVTALGGAEKRFLKVSKVWLKKGAKLTVIEATPSLLKETEDGIIDVCEIALPIKYQGRFWFGIYLQWILWILKAMFKGTSIVKNRKINLILATNNTVPNLLPAYFIHALFRYPLCVTVHHIDVPTTNNKVTLSTMFHIYRKISYSRLTSFLKAIASILSVQIARKATLCIAVSHSTAETLMMNGVEKERIYVSGNGVNLDYIEQIEYEGEKLYDGVFVGRISKEKGVFHLLKVWKKVSSVKPKAKLLIIGSGVEESKLKQEVLRLNLAENVTLTGKVSDELLYKMLKASRIFIFPSFLEGWGLAVAEALACGLPVVCYDIPAIRENFGECESVFRVRLNDYSALTRKVMELLSLSNEEMKRLSEISKLYVKKFSWLKVAERDINIICKGTLLF